MGLTALTLAIMVNHTIVLETLAAAGADLNMQDEVPSLSIVL
jgi:hypothetical protein